MTARVCSTPGCPRRVPADARGGRCTSCAREHEQARGSATARGYDTEHRAERARWEQRLADGEQVICRRAPSGHCLRPEDPIVHPDDTWHLGHPDTECPAPRAPEHERCNLATATRRTPHVR